MATSSEFWQRVATTVSSSPEWAGEAPEDSVRGNRGTVKMWMVLDAMTIIGSAALATIYEMHTSPIEGLKGLLRGTLFHGRSLGILLILLCGFTLSLLLTSRRLHLYAQTEQFFA
jgi:hypothetical protein